MRPFAHLLPKKLDDTLAQGWAVAFVAVFSYATARALFHLGESYWAPIAAVIVLYPDAKATRKASSGRFLGTVVGCFVGWAAAQWWNHHILLFGLAIFLGVGICMMLRLESASRLCAVAIIVITPIPRSEPAYLVAISRCFEVSYGVLCALGYSVLQQRWTAYLQSRRRSRIT